MSSNEPQARHWVVDTVSKKKEFLDEFVEEGVWRIVEPTSRIRGLVKSMKAGDRIAAKTTFVTKSGVPFDNKGNPVSVMRINAVGTVVENFGGGEEVRVEWEPWLARDWYFRTSTHKVTRLTEADHLDHDLIRFAFEGQEQDLKKYLSHPYWRDRYLDRYAWTQFFEDFATSLLDYRHDRPVLVEKLLALALSKSVKGFGSLKDRPSRGTVGVLTDICPFTTIGIFNRSTRQENRHKIGKALGEVLEVPGEPPHDFAGIPRLNNMNVYFFPPAYDRSPDHIEKLWRVFETGIAYADSYGTIDPSDFIEAFDEASALKNVRWNLTFGLYWARPWFFLGLDSRNREVLAKVFRVSLKGVPTGRDYVAIMNTLRGYFELEECPVRSFPEFSRSGSLEPFNIPADQVSEAMTDDYTASDIVAEGAFLSEAQIEKLLERVRTKKNLILQGPPGTGKTWLARRLGYAIVGERESTRVKSVQFHQNLTYEDFVRGYRPSADGKLVVSEGIFMTMVRAAIGDPNGKYVLVIEEINRGNPAQIFGELLTLLEDSKRDESESIELTYPDEEGIRSVYVPDNLYIVGTMNLADRSLALVDLALRRRFAFADLQPEFGDAWRKWVAELGFAEHVAHEIARRMSDLNQMIEDDSRLGKQFRVGHSYVTPSEELSQESWTWFQDVVEHEIAPLLEEYWFDSPKDFKAAVERLKQPF